jgi:two-component system LytT family response regulator/two-component system response regulator LytT
VFASVSDSVVHLSTMELSGETNFRTLEELQANLDPEIFWRVHRSFLVNLNKIKEVVPWFNRTLQLKMADKRETEIPVSRSHSRRLKEYLKL